MSELCVHPHFDAFMCVAHDDSNPTGICMRRARWVPKALLDDKGMIDEWDGAAFCDDHADGGTP